MPETDAPGMQAQGRVIDAQSLALAEPAPQVSRIATDRQAQVRKVDPDLIRAASQGPRFQHASPIGESLLNPKLGARRQARVLINGS
jgi:hypothetical protein